MTWFKTGRKMKGPDGDIECTVRAENELQHDEYIKKGWTPCSDDKPATIPGKAVDGVTGLTNHKKPGRSKKNG